jgi:adenine-specific DNA-methyltransferase
MRKLTLNDPETQSADIVSANIDALKGLFPDAFTEGRVDFEVLKLLLGAAVEEREEKYGLNWHGKRRARQIALTPSTGTLLPCPEESVDWDTTQNLMIEGDNLEVLKLLQKSYAGKVKLIYIDPPYNTGNDFVYKDDFKDGLANYLRMTGQIDGNGTKNSSNSESSGRFHADWLSMVYPRIKLAQKLLKRDGAIFVSCDEAEQTRLRLVMDEIFGQENFVADLVWAAGRKNDARLISISHEYIVCYARDAGYLAEEKIEWRQRKKGLEEIYAEHNRLRKIHGTKYESITEGMKSWFKGLPDSHPAKAHKHYSHADIRGLYFPDNISWPGGGGPKYEVLHPKTKKPVSVPSRGWMTSDPEKMKKWIEDDLVHFGEDENYVPCIKSYLNDREQQTPYSVFYQDGRAASKRLRFLMGGDCFDFPKDELVMQEIVEMMTSDKDIVIDFFAGSGTTAHAVMAQNAVDQGARKFILVQLPELLDPDRKEQAFAARFCDDIGKSRNIAELTKERLRRAADSVKKQNPIFAGDTGFRVFKLAPSNIRAWEPDATDLDNSLLKNAEHLVQGRTEQDVLYELLLKLGLDLCVPIEAKTIAGKSVHAIGGGTLIVCLADGLTKDVVEPLAAGIVAWRAALAPALDTRIVFKDSGFADDIAKTNMAAILSQAGIADIRSL